MGELSQRLQDASRSGVYRAPRADDIVSAAAGRLSLVKVRFQDKHKLLRGIASAMDFPKWFGENWDALEDCLSDLSWRKAKGHVLVFEHATPGDDFGVLVDVLRSTAEYWATRGTPFFAVFIDPAGVLPLPELASRK
jgi:RNAse (barnase) inhibitor barstar